MDEQVDLFVAITGTSSDVARRYIGMTDGNAEQAVQLFFDSPDLASSVGQASQAPPVPTSTHPQRAASGGRQDEQGIVHIDSDDENMEVDDDRAASRAEAPVSAADYEDDEAMARRLQEDLYKDGAEFGEDGVRAPIARTTETLVGGPGGDWPPEDMGDIMRQMRSRQPRQGPPGVFNQRPVPSIWDESADPEARSRGFAQATGGASTSSAKSARLAELFRPPFELMQQIPWDDARHKGKEELKWILVNVQDPSIFYCQQLNRDIWRNQGIQDLVRENFIFMQFSKDDPRGNQYTQYYFQQKDNDDAYPHIAIVDPRTGEQVKVWSGPPVPVAGDFLMQLVEFLDRYSLDVTKKNPVAKRKLEKPKSMDVSRLTEEEMLDLALQNSLSNGNEPGPKEVDPDDLTKSFGDISKGKGKEAEQEAEAEPSNGKSSAPPSAFSQILSSNPHTPPAPGAGARMQFKFPDGSRDVRSFALNDPVRRIYEWLKAEPREGKEGVEFELKSMGKDLIEQLDESVQAAGLKGGTIMVEFIEG